jgi:hypothetical protein
VHTILIGTRTAKFFQDTNPYIALNKEELQHRQQQYCCSLFNLVDVLGEFLPLVLKTDKNFILIW